MAQLVNTFFEERVEQLFGLAELVERIFSSAGLDYRIVGGLAAYLYVEQVEPDAGRLTKDVDLAVRRQDLREDCGGAEGIRTGIPARRERGYAGAAGAAVGASGGPSGFRRREGSAGIRGDCAGIGAPAPNPRAAPVPVADLVKMKLTSFRFKDQAHLKDLDDAGAITPEIETALSPVLAERLARVRAGE